MTVTGAPTEIFARDLGRFVTNSNLVKCAIAGCDPNVGRIVGAIGSFLGNYVDNGAQYTAGLSVTLGGIDIFSEGCFQLNPEKVRFFVPAFVSGGSLAAFSPGFFALTCGGECNRR